ncbi:MAG TPA: TonB-dependent receptor [candidate division Zixibacteria bacterium]|nr:TonB-dependent receptor [candidate division Zixibacteria bacterium]
MKTKLLLSVVLIVCLAFGAVWSAVTGRITGVITNSETKQAIPGVTVSVVGTTLGAITDENGKYTVLNVPVDNYTLRITSVGYRTVEISNVSVSSDLASFHDIALESSTEALGDVIRVVAETPMIIKDKVASINIVKRDELLAMPTRGFEEVVGIQTGVVQVKPNLGPRGLRGQREATNAPELNIRGGRPSEVAYYVDGYSQQDPLSGNSTANISNNAIKEVSIVSGGFPAEYGHVAAGIVNVVTNSGGTEYHGNAEVVTDNWADGGFKRTYDQNWYTFDLSGPIPGISNSFFFGSIERRYHGDREPSAVTEDVLAGEPGRLAGNWLDGWSYQGKLDFKPTENVQLAFSGNASKEEWSEYTHSYLFNAEHMPYYEDKNIGLNAKLTHTLNSHSFYTLSGSYFNTDRFRGDGVHRKDIWAYGRPAGNPANDNETLFRAWDDMNLDSLGNQIVTPTDYITDTVDGVVRTFIGPGDESHVYDDYLKRKSAYFGFKGQMTNEINSDHTLKGGFEFNRHTLRFYQHFIPVNVWNGVAGNGFQDANRYGYDMFGEESDDQTWQNDTKHPIDLGLFLQDRLEYKGLIVTGGLRYDYFDYKAQRLRNPELPLDPDSLQFDTISTNDNFAQTLEEGDTESSKAFTRLSPRLGIAFPIDDKTQMRVSYGQFYQRSELQNLYVGYDYLDYKIRTGGYYVAFGNPNLEPPKTTAYEIGVSRQLGEYTAFDLNVFYKDVSDLVQVYTQPSLPRSFSTYRNSDYGTIKGMEFELKTRRTNQITLNLKYTLSFASGTGSYANSQGNVAWVNANGPLQTAPLDFDQTHKFVGIFDLRYGKKEGPRMGDSYPLQNFGLNVILQAASGLPYTPIVITNEATLASFAPVALDTRNSENGPWTLIVDLKLERGFSLGKYTLSPYLWVKNLLDRDNVVQVWEGSGRANSTGWLETPEGQQFASAHSQIDDTSGLTGEEKYELAQFQPQNYANPRMVYFGLRASF